MSTERDVLIVRSWLAEGPTTLPEGMIEDVLRRIPATRQRRAWSPRDMGSLITPTRVAAAGGLLVLLAILGIGLSSPRVDVPMQRTGASPSPQPGASASASDLDPPADVAAYVRSAYEGLVRLPALTVTVVETEGTKGRYAYDGSEALRLDHFSNATDETPSEFLLFTRDTRGELAQLDGRPIWLEMSGQGHPLAELAFALGLQQACDTAWQYVGLVTVLERPAHHVACGESGMWLDVETRLPLRSVYVQDPTMTIVRDVTEFSVGAQPAALFEPPAGAEVMSDAEFQCASEPACASPAPQPTRRPFVTPAPAPGDGNPPNDLDELVANTLMTIDQPPGLAMSTVDGSGGRAWYYSDGRGRSRADYGSEPTLHDPAEMLLVDGHLYEHAEGDRYLDLGPRTTSLLPDWGLRAGCLTGWEYAGLDRVLDRPAHHLRCDRQHYWIDRDWGLVTRHQGDPAVLEYEADVDEVLDVRFLAPAPDFLRMPSAPSASDPAASGPALSWRQVPLDVAAPVTVWLGDRFLVLDPIAGLASVSQDGASWAPVAQGGPDHPYLEVVGSGGGTVATWGEALVHWDARTVRALMAPGGSVGTRDFEGDIGALGIGPAGIVARVHSGIDFDAFVTSFIGPDWVGHMTSFEFVDGVLHIATDDGRAVDIDVAAEGLGPGDVADRGYGWFSPDGVTWTTIPDFPSNITAVVGVADGFIARAEGMWHSVDGLDWRPIDGPPLGDGELLPWQDGAVEVGSTGQPVLWTSSGGRTLSVPSTALPFGGRGPRALGTGPFGLVAIGTADTAFVTDDHAWRRTPLRPAMYAATGGREPARIVVGDDGVLVTLRSTDEVPSLWLGTHP